MIEHESLVEPKIEDKATAYYGGFIEYSTVGDEHEEHNPVLIVPGFTGGRQVLEKFAVTLSSQGERKVIYPAQPTLDVKLQEGLPIVDHHAMALLEVIDAEGLRRRSVDIITHSFGSIVAVRMAELAKVMGMMSFDSEKGSHSVFISPAGSNDKENLVYLGGRWASFIGRSYIESFLSGKELDPTGAMTKAGVKNFTKDKVKTAKEVNSLSKKSSIYENLGNIGIKPFVLGYSNDYMFPDRVVKTAIKSNGSNLEGYAMPIDTGGIGAASFSEFKAKTGLTGKEARKSWTHHYRNAGHNDFQFHPERTVAAILQVIDR